MKERILELQEQAAVTEVEMGRLRAQIRSLEQRLSSGASTQAAGPSAGLAEPPTPAQTPPPLGNTSEVSIEETDLEPGPAVGSATGFTSGPGGVSDSREHDCHLFREPVGNRPATRGAGGSGPSTIADIPCTIRASTSMPKRAFSVFSRPIPPRSSPTTLSSGLARADSSGETLAALSPAFREVLQKYPEGNKVPDALIKEGDCLEQLGDRDGAPRPLQRGQEAFSRYGCGGDGRGSAGRARWLTTRPGEPLP